MINEKKVKSLEQQIVSYKKQIEGYESTKQLNDILGKQKKYKDMTSVGFNTGECSNQNQSIRNNFLTIKIKVSSLMHSFIIIVSFAIILDTR